MQEVYEFLKKAGTYYLATVDGDQPRVRPFGTVNIFDGKLYIQTGQVKDVPAAEFAALLGHEIPVRDVELDRNLCFRDFDKGRSPLLALAGVAAKQAVRRAEATGTPSTSASFVYNMPLRALAKDVGQFFSMGMVDALVREAKGWGVAGVAPALAVRVLTKRHFMLTWGLWMVLPLAGSAVAHAVIAAQGPLGQGGQGGIAPAARCVGQGRKAGAFRAVRFVRTSSVSSRAQLRGAVRRTGLKPVCSRAYIQRFQPRTASRAMR